MSDFERKDCDFSEGESKRPLDSAGEDGFLSDGRCEDDYETHETHTYDRGGDDGYSREEGHDDVFSSGSYGGSRYVGGGFYRRADPYREPTNAPDENAKEVRQGGNGLGIASMICGIASVFLCCTVFFGLIAAVTGLVLGIISQKRKANGFALAGIITSSFGIVFGVIMITSLVELEDVWTDIVDSSGSDPLLPYDPNNGACLRAIKYVASFLRLK